MKLKLCPFCEGPAGTIDDPNRCKVFCVRCFSQTWEHFTLDEAIEAWNTRVVDIIETPEGIAVKLTRPASLVPKEDD